MPLLLALVLLANVSEAIAADSPDFPHYPFAAIFVSDPQACAAAAKTNLSQALWDLNATAILPRQWQIGQEWRCDVTHSESEPSATGEQLYNSTSCTTMNGPYDDFVVITRAMPKDAQDQPVGELGDALEFSSRYVDEAMGAPTIVTYYRCEGMDPATIDY